jgi:hypothetical protein
MAVDAAFSEGAASASDTVCSKLSAWAGTVIIRNHAIMPQVYCLRPAGP